MINNFRRYLCWPNIEVELCSNDEVVIGVVVVLVAMNDAHEFRTSQSCLLSLRSNLEL